MNIGIFRHLSGRKYVRQEHDRSISNVIVLFTCCVSLVLLVSCGKDTSQSASRDVAVKTNKGGVSAQSLLSTRCSTCHNVDRIKKAKKTLVEWEQTVNRMVVKGAKLDKEEKVVLADFLARIYKP
jgi:hypothetical protein